MKLEYIIFEFDNFDELRIEGKYVDYLRIDDIKTRFSSFSSFPNEPVSISKIETAGFFEAVINKNANMIRYQFNDTSNEELKQYTFERLECRDITDIRFEISGDDKMYHYVIQWSDDAFINKAQESHIDDYGNINILIDEHKRTRPEEISE